MSIENKKNIFFVSTSIKELRKINNLTLEQFSKLIGISNEAAVSYERESNIIPSLDKLVKISSFFSVSIDFLLLWKYTNYPKNLKLIKLAKNLDELSQAHERSHIEITAQSFLDRISDKNIDLKQDTIDINLSNNIHENIKVIKEYKDISSKQLIDFLGVSKSQISQYQNKATPSPDKLLKLSEIFNISMHFLVTGEKLSFDFKDGHFSEIIFLTDKFLSLDHQRFLIELIENIFRK